MPIMLIFIFNSLSVILYLIYFCHCLCRAHVKSISYILLPMLGSNFRLCSIWMILISLLELLFWMILIALFMTILLVIELLMLISLEAHVHFNYVGYFRDLFCWCLFVQVLSLGQLEMLDKRIKLFSRCNYVSNKLQCISLKLGSFIKSMFVFVI